MRYLFCYDISSPKRLHKVAKELETHGIRIQKSFFYCDLRKGEIDILKDILLEYLEFSEDRLSIYCICDRCYGNAKSFGKQITLEFPEFYLL